MDINSIVGGVESYIMPLALIVCLSVGYIIKHLVPTDRINRFIPLIVGACGVFIAVWNAGWQIDSQVLVRGLVSGLASTGAHEAFSGVLKK